MSFNSLLYVILHSISLAVKTAVPCMDFLELSVVE
jgi:hypothetical protein